MINEPGVHRLSRRDCELYSVMILSAGSWGRVRIEDGNRRGLWAQPSTFTGSFWLSVAACGGLIVSVWASGASCNLTVNYREKDCEVV